MKAFFKLACMVSGLMLAVACGVLIARLRYGLKQPLRHSTKCGRWMMSDWKENLKRYALSDDMDYRLTWEDAAIALEEIERLEGTNKVLGQWVEDKDRHIERLRAALDRIANNIDECDGLHMKEIACKALSARYKEDE